METSQSKVEVLEHTLTEEARRATGVSVCSVAAGVDIARPDPEVRERRIHRRMTAEYKLRILREADSCDSGELGALLRREGLYSSYLVRWRKQRERGTLSALATRKRGRKENPDQPLLKKIVAQECEIDRLKKRLKQAETIIDVQKKVSEILGIDLKSNEGNGRSE